VADANVQFGVIGRDAELVALERFLDRLPKAPAALVIEGEAGIGKTTLWLEGVRIAGQRGLRVLQAQPAESEARLSYAALTDLFANAFGEMRGLLPPPQESALAAAVLQAHADDTIDARTTATAVLGVLTALVRQHPVLVAIDDVQWLDPASERALTFALRRAPAGVGILLARRSGSDGALVKELEHSFRQGRLEHVRVGPLSLAGLHHLLALHLRRAPARPALGRIAAASGGNPFYALELTRALAAEGGDHALADPLPLPRSLQALVAARLERLSPTARHVLAAAAAASRPTAATLVDALEPEVDAQAGLAEAEEARVIESARGRIRFSHPLVASVVYSSLTAARRRALHRRFAGVVDDGEERARHLALSATAADDVIAGELEEAGVEAAARGAQDAAAADRLGRRRRDRRPRAARGGPLRAGARALAPRMADRRAGTVRRPRGPAPCRGPRRYRRRVAERGDRAATRRRCADRPLLRGDDARTSSRRRAPASRARARAPW
jgi:predicted ATPase